MWPAISSCLVGCEIKVAYEGAGDDQSASSPPSSNGPGSERKKMMMNKKFDRDRRTTHRDCTKNDKTHDDEGRTGENRTGYGSMYGEGVLFGRSVVIAWNRS